MEWKEGPLLVLAGPGSGKTAVLTLRLARLLEEDDDTAALGLTFTNKAAAEMRERVDHILGEYTDRAQLCTFHKFAADILGQHGSHIGIRPDFQILTQDEDRVVILEEVIREFPDRGRHLPSDRTNLLHLIDRLLSESYSGEGRSLSLASTPDWLPLLFRRYTEALVGAPPARLRQLAPFLDPLARGEACHSPGGPDGDGRISASTNSRTQTELNTSFFASSRRVASTTCSLSRTTTRSSTSGTELAPSGSVTCAGTTSWRPSSCPRAIAVHPRSWIMPID